MKGFLEVIDTESYEVKTQISYHTLQQFSSSKKKAMFKELYGPYKCKQIKLTCQCSDEPLKMRISYRESFDTYYISTFPNKAHKHAEGCFFYHDNSLNSSGSIDKKSIIEEDDGRYRVHLNAHDYKNKKKVIVKEDDEPTSTLKPKVYDQDIGVSHNKTSHYQLTRLIVTNAWNTYIYFQGKKKYPDIVDTFNQIYRSTLKKFKITDDISLEDVVFNSGSPGRIYFIERKYKKKTQPFVIFLLKSIDREDDHYYINAENPVTKDFYTFMTPKDIGSYAEKMNRLSNDRFIVSGFVKSKGKGEAPELISLSLLPINNNGIPVESSYERRLYDYLCEKERLIQKPIDMDTKYHPKWDGLVPDGLLIDTKPPTIIEVFGMSESNVEYHLHREYKIKHFTSLKPSYDFWYWDAFKTKDITFQTGKDGY
jgi:hypothetical protein